MRRQGLLFALVMVGCSDVRLDFPDTEIKTDVVDNELRIDGKFCTSPAADVSYPVKVMFIVDGSGSQQFADQNRQRVVAVQNAINALRRSPNTYFKVIVFNASVTAIPTFTGSPLPPAFTNDLADLTVASTLLAEADTLTDYQGALAVAYSELSRDMNDVRTDPTRGLAELSRTKYVVIFISDGIPDPQCTAGPGNDFDAFGNPFRLCEDQQFLACLLQAGVCPDSSLCNATTACSGGAFCPLPDCFNYDINGNQFCDDGNGTTCFLQPNADLLFGGLNNLGLAAGNDYNQPYQILDRVADIMKLEERFQIGELRIHAGLVLDPQADPAVIAIFGDSSQAAPLMKQVAEVGNGRFMEFYGGDEIDFLEINFDSLKQNRVVRGFYAQNLAATRTTRGLEPDTDYDGLPDALEYEIGTKPLAKDSDNDGFSDYLEWTKRGFAFDPMNPCKPALVDPNCAPPAAACSPTDSTTWHGNCCPAGFVAGQPVYDDLDVDGLVDCEERVLGTTRDVVDTDADGIPDLIDFISGLDPLVWDYDKDADQDGIPNGVEMEWHLNPIITTSDRDSRDRYRYDRPKTEVLLDGRTCYDFRIRGMQLAPTKDNQDDPYPNLIGMNEIRVNILENMSDNLSGQPLARTACIRPRYVPPSIKVPASGLVILDEDDFHYLPAQDPIMSDPSLSLSMFDPAVHCIQVQ